MILRSEVNKNSEAIIDVIFVVFLDFVNNRDWIWIKKCFENHNKNRKLSILWNSKEIVYLIFQWIFFHHWWYQVMAKWNNYTITELTSVCVIFIVVVFFLAFCFLSSFWNSIGHVIFRLFELNLKFNFVVHCCIKAVRGNHYGWMHRNFYWLQNFYCIIIGTDVEVVQMVASTQRPSKHYKREHPKLG